MALKGYWLDEYRQPGNFGRHAPDEISSSGAAQEAARKQMPKVDKQKQKSIAQRYAKER
jgi:hypothetical protein